MIARREIPTDLEILRRALESADDALTDELAHWLLRFRFSEPDRARMASLSERARAGELTEEEEQEMDSLMRVGAFMGALQSKARRKLRMPLGTPPDA